MTTDGHNAQYGPSFWSIEGHEASPGAVGKGCLLKATSTQHWRPIFHLRFRRRHRHRRATISRCPYRHQPQCHHHRQPEQRVLTTVHTGGGDSDRISTHKAHLSCTSRRCFEALGRWRQWRPLETLINGDTQERRYDTRLQLGLGQALWAEPLP